jgi:hypothetical protein
MTIHVDPLDLVDELKCLADAAQPGDDFSPALSLFQKLEGLAHGRSNAVPIRHNLLVTNAALRDIFSTDEGLERDKARAQAAHAIRGLWLLFNRPVDD